MRVIRSVLAVISLFVMMMFIARAQEDPNRFRNMEAMMTERRLTVLEDFMAEMRRNAERTATLQTAVVAGVAGLVLEMIFRTIRGNKKL